MRRSRCASTTAGHTCPRPLPPWWCRRRRWWSQRRPLCAPARRGSASALAQQGAQTEKALNEARRLVKAGDNARAAAVAAEALKTTPNNVALQAVQQEAARKAQQAQIEAERRRGAVERAGAVAAAQKRQ